MTDIVQRLRHWAKDPALSSDHGLAEEAAAVIEKLRAYILSGKIPRIRTLSPEEIRERLDIDDPEKTP